MIATGLKVLELLLSISMINYSIESSMWLGLSGLTIAPVAIEFSVRVSARATFH